MSFNLQEITDNLNTELNGLEPVRIKLPTIMGKDYILCEASGDAATSWRNKQLKSAKMIDGKVSGIEGIADCEPLLVSKCVALTDKDGNIQMRGNDICFIDEAQVKRWPYKIQKTLFNTILEITPSLNETKSEEQLEKEINLLQKRLRKMREIKTIKGEEDPSKNLQESMTDGSA